MKFIPYSYSKIATYNQCPKKFDFKYIQKIEEPIKNKEALLKGKCIHSLIENYPNLSDNSLVPKYIDIFENFLKTKYKVLLDIEHVSEEGIGLDKNLNPTDYKNGELFRGFIDYYAFINENTMIIVDWKTGKAKDLKYQDFTQVMFYALYMFLKYPKLEKIKAMFIYVEHNTDNSIIFERKFLENYKINFLENIKNIEFDNNFNKKPQRLCEWCGYKDICNP